jgi:hypothetical protein
LSVPLTDSGPLLLKAIRCDDFHRFGNRSSIGLAGSLGSRSIKNFQMTDSLCRAPELMGRVPQLQAHTLGRSKAAAGYRGLMAGTGPSPSGHQANIWQPQDLNMPATSAKSPGPAEVPEP